MRTRFIKYGRSVKLKDGAFEHAEVSMELEPRDYEEEAFARAKKLIKAQLNVDQPLKASIGDILKSSTTNKENAHDRQEGKYHQPS